MADDLNCFGLIFNFLVCGCVSIQVFVVIKLSCCGYLFSRKAAHALNGFPGQIS